MNKHSQRGLSLVELMVVVAILGILGSVVYPMYTDQARKGRRADAKAVLETIAVAQERFYTANGRYTNDLADLTVAGGLVNALAAGESEDGYYAVALAFDGGDNQTYTATATAQGVQAKDTACASFTINQLGQKSGANGEGDASDCWGL